ncbi:MAG: ABC transporter permease [Pseudomonadota bacterium]
MASPLRDVSRPGTVLPTGGSRWLALAPGVTSLLFLAPVGAGLLFTLLPAFGWLPALGGERLTLDPWRALFAEPGLAGSVALTLGSGLSATLVSLLLALGFLAACRGSALDRLMRRLLAPILALPHVAIAIGFAFLAAPSGWIARALSPWLTGWAEPPDLALAPDPYGIALAIGLVLKETPYLLLMGLAASAQLPVDDSIAVGRSLGYGPVAAWTKLVLPRLYPLIRLPVYAVLAFSLSVVDVALVLAPDRPAPLQLLVLRWFNDPDLALRFQAAAGAMLQLALASGAIALWHLGERLVGAAARPWLSSGKRGGGGRLAEIGFGVATALLLLLALSSLAAMALWSVAGSWRFPDALPASVDLSRWSQTLPMLARPALITLALGLGTALLAGVLALACLENEAQAGLHPGPRTLWLLYLPLLLPQLAFLFGTQLLFLFLGIDGGWLALGWSHLLFVLPYLFLPLADPFRAIDARYRRAARCLGASRARTFFHVVLPLAARPLAAALAVGFAVSVGLYLPTLFAGGGRFPTLTTEAVALAAGADRRLAGLAVLLQAALPLLAFAAALIAPRANAGTRQ